MSAEGRAPLPVEAAELVSELGLEPHPEGGWFRETWRAPAPAGERSAGTAIYFLLVRDEPSHWHRVDADEVWHHYVGDPLGLAVAAAGGMPRETVLGPSVADGQRPQALVPAGHWQAARTLGSWTLAGCTVSPAFSFDGFELAPPGWSPEGGTTPTTR